MVERNGHADHLSTVLIRWREYNFLVFDGIFARPLWDVNYSTFSLFSPSLTVGRKLSLSGYK